MKHFRIRQESLRCKFSKSSTVSIKPNNILMLKTHVILFQSYWGCQIEKCQHGPWYIIS